MKILLVGALGLLVTLSINADLLESRLERLRKLRQRTNKPSLSTEPIETTTTIAEITTLDKIMADLKSERGRKIDELLSKKDKCGLLKVNTTAPWIVVIEHTDPTGKSPRKTLSKGVLISDQHVLTTVSSVHNSHPFWVVSSVRLGDPATWITETSQRIDANYTRIEVEQVFQHSSKDIAVIKLAQKVQFTDYILPICLPIDDIYNFREMYFHMCKRSQDKDRKLDVKLISSLPLGPQDCETLFHRKGAQFGTTEFCAWDEFGDNCTGDVGGPLMARFNGIYIVIGLNTYVFTTREFDADDYPGVYVKVGSFLKWIETVRGL